MKQAALVFLYGPKRDPRLAALLQECQRRVAEMLGEQFVAYEPRQVHATLLGLEQVWHDGRLVAANFLRYRGRAVPLDFGGLLAHLRRRSHWPLLVRIGGFHNRRYPFASRGRWPYQRSFLLNGADVVLVGWPVRRVRGSAAGREVAVDAEGSVAINADDGLLYPAALDAMRRGAQQFGALHAYHAHPRSIDNDFYLKLGTLADPAALSTADRSRLVRRLRAWLGSLGPQVFRLGPEDLWAVSYSDRRLPWASRCLALADRRLTAARLAALYD